MRCGVRRDFLAFGGCDRWASAGHALIVGGGFAAVQFIGDSGPCGERERRRNTLYTPANVLATLDRSQRIDPGAPLPDLSGRPMDLLDERKPSTELL
ncbi:MAG: hypothetical protein U0744_08040 [Gemmataceae bacterium]